MSYALSIDLVRPFDEVVAQVRDALAANGFGIVAEIDMQKTLALKIGVEIEPHLILGACNPRFAHQALQVEPSIACCCRATSSSGGPARSPSSRPSTPSRW
jgi:uncharacterized protein (DUF302 family)